MTSSPHAVATSETPCRFLRSLPDHSHMAYVGIIRSLRSLVPSLGMTAALRSPAPWVPWARFPPPLLTPLASSPPAFMQPVAGFKMRCVLRLRCKDCYFVRRRGHMCVICKTHPRHKQRKW
ncbi:large ribosomal subunit protein bL36m [Petromyzon marinus]|uniref:Ribosomal protein n=1 Tax=Petromyzon marinus TaxID=7757 RepID=A0AAJ7U6G8_PETMA|nr:39S ribosomal protein L36, mitochondrial [Petromyzon marinus]